VDGREWIVTAVDDTDCHLLAPGGAEVSARYVCKRADLI
jgi:hypothetical protein